MRLSLVGVAAAALLFAVPAAHADLVTNGGFEDGNFTGWALVGSTVDNGVTHAPYVHTGAWGAFLGQKSGLGTLSQSIATTLNQDYAVAFWIETVGNTSDNSISANFGNTTLLNATNFSTNGWVEYTGTLVATSASTSLQFSFFNSPGFFGLDDVCVGPGSQISCGTMQKGPAVPEPMTLGLVGSGLAAAGAFARRRKQKKA
jgi:hypothetical protein